MKSNGIKHLTDLKLYATQNYIAKELGITKANLTQWKKQNYIPETHIPKLITLKKTLSVLFKKIGYRFR